MNLTRIASRVALPMTRFLEKDSKSSGFVRNKKRETQYRKFFQNLDIDIQVISYPGAEPYDESEIQQFLTPNVVTIVEGALSGGDHDPAWLVHDALGHSSGYENYWIESPVAIRKLSKAFASDGFPYALWKGTASLGDPLESVVEALPDNFFPRKSVETVDRFAEFAVKYAMQNGKLPRFKRLPDRIWIVSPGGSDAIADIPGVQSLRIYRDDGTPIQNLIPGSIKTSPARGLPNITAAINEIFEHVYDRIRRHLEAHKGSYITDDRIDSSSFPDLFDRDIGETDK